MLKEEDNQKFEEEARRIARNLVDLADSIPDKNKRETKAVFRKCSLDLMKMVKWG